MTKPLTVDKMRPTHLVLLRSGEPVRILEVPDPRESMVRAHERIGDEFTVQPISAATAKRLKKLEK
jgi:hypothetical protein